MTTRHLFVIGGQRCGTTSLASTLDQHPSIELAKPLRPEPKFFLEPGSEVNTQEYVDRFFASAADSEPSWLVEKSTTYYERADAAQRILTAFPDSRIMAILRHPIDRAISNYKFSRQNGLEEREISVALDPATKPPHSGSNMSTSPFDYVARGRYELLLAPWIESFGRERSCVLLFSSLHEQTAQAEIESFMGLAPDSLPSFPSLNLSHGSASLPPALYAELRSYFAATTSWVEDLCERSLVDWPK